MHDASVRSGASWCSVCVCTSDLLFSYVLGEQGLSESAAWCDVFCCNSAMAEPSMGAGATKAPAEITQDSAPTAMVIITIISPQRFCEQGF